MAIDIGNTQTAAGLYRDHALVASWRVATRAGDTADELLMTLRELFALRGLSLASVRALAVASVVPPLTEQYQTLGQNVTGSAPFVLTGDMPCGLNIRYTNPADIGADRIADALAAIELYGAPVIVVDFGTATNIEIVDKDGFFIGGIIAPGLQTSAEALFAAAARLSKVSIEVPATVIGSNTRAAVQAGLTYGEIDRIDGLVERIFAELGYRAPVIATGGLLRRVVALSRTITATNETLTLEGLRIAWQRQAEADAPTKSASG